MVQKIRKGVSQKQYISMYKEVFSSPTGQKVLHDICRRWYVHGNVAGQDASKIEDMLIRIGMRNAALDLLSKVNYDLDQLADNMKQHKLEVQYD
jgi:hypothetical protein